MRLNQTTTQSLVNRVANFGGMDRDAVVVGRGSLAHRILAERARHRGPGSRVGYHPGRSSSCQCELERESMPAMSKPTSPATAALPGPIWATLVIERALLA